MQKMAPIVLAGFCSLALAGSAAAAPRLADGRNAEPPYCLQGETYGHPGNCQFWSYEQCMATASGTYDTCAPNPRYLFARRTGVYR